MSRIITWCSSIMITRALLAYVRFTPSVASSACVRCGLVIAVQRVDGTSSSRFLVALSQQKQSPCSVVLEVTDEGKHSILCGCSPLDALR
jgi:hypothetical protein